jgi:hypothetical protein
VDAFVVYDCSKYDSIDLSKYEKVRKHVKGVWNPFDNPFGSMFTQALKLADSDTVLFLDIDEIFEFKTTDLRTLVKQYPLSPGGGGIAFSLRNYYCSRNYTVGACSSKGSHVFANHPEILHDALAGYWQHRSRIRRTNEKPDGVDGVRLCNQQGHPMPHYEPIPLDDVVIHHTSHLDNIGKHIRSIVQFNHTSVLDLQDFYPYDMRLRPELVDKLINIGEKEIQDRDVLLWDKPEPFEYEPNELLDRFVARAGIKEFDPTEMKDYARYANEG